MLFIIPYSRPKEKTLAQSFCTFFRENSAARKTQAAGGAQSPARRSENYFLTPEEEYEERGFVPNVVFPCAALSDAKTGRIAIYYGAADSYVALAFTDVDRIVEYIIQHNRLR